MSSCLHRTLVEGSCAESECVYGHDVCGLCRNFIYETKLSCPECGKNVCLRCFPQCPPDIGFTLYLATSHKHFLLSKYKETPESATTLFVQEQHKTAVFLAHKERSVDIAKLDLAQASARLAQAESELNEATDRLAKLAVHFETTPQ